MNRPDTTKFLSELLERYIKPYNDSRIYWAKEVTFDYSSSHSIRVDYMRFKPINNTVSGIEKGDVYCYEIKSSAEDFKSKNGHNFIGDMNYYVMLEETYNAVKSSIPFYIGVLVPNEYDNLKVLKKPKRKDRNRPVSEVLLMMWRSSARELNKLKKCGMIDD